ALRARGPWLPAELRPAPIAKAGRGIPSALRSSRGNVHTRRVDPLESHSYPHHLTEAVLAAIDAGGLEIVDSPLLTPPLLEAVFSTIFQASLLRDEGREVFFRALLCPPGVLAEEAGPPPGLHAMRFHEFRRFRVQELRRLANAAPYQRALLGICVDASGHP